MTDADATWLLRTAGYFARRAVFNREDALDVASAAVLTFLRADRYDERLCARWRWWARGIIRLRVVDALRIRYGTRNTYRIELERADEFDDRRAARRATDREGTEQVWRDLRRSCRSRAGGRTRRGPARSRCAPTACQSARSAPCFW